MSVIVVTRDKSSEFETQLSSSKQLVVVDFTASWCRPCRQIAPIYEQLAVKYPQAMFVKVDVDICHETALIHGVTSLPTFMFYKNGVKIDCIIGANSQLLEDKIKQYCRSDSGENEKTHVNSQIDLYPFIIKTQCEALNESDDHPLTNCLRDDETYLQSDCDNQLIIPIAFSQPVKVHSIKIKAPESAGPKTVKIFINQPTVLDFDRASNNIPTQSIDINSSDLTSKNLIGLQFVKFQNVENIHIFVQNNQDGSDITRIDYLQLFGSPISVTNMNDFKRVAGKKGEVDH